jgi:hypothetical protein
MKQGFVIAVLICIVATVVSSAQNNRHFGGAAFKTEFWINNKEVFTNPKHVDVEFVSAGAFDWVIADEHGKQVKTKRHSNEHGGWTGIDFPSLGLRGNYSVSGRATHLVKPQSPC